MPRGKGPIWKGFASYFLKLFDRVASISSTDVRMTRSAMPGGCFWHRCCSEPARAEALIIGQKKMIAVLERERPWKSGTNRLWPETKAKWYTGIVTDITEGTHSRLYGNLPK